MSEKIPQKILFGRQRLIDCDDLLIRLYDLADAKYTVTNWTQAFYDITDEIKNSPWVEPEDFVRHGKWLLEREPTGKPYCFHCSACDSDFSRISIVSATPFCPWCGAKMDEEKTDE